MKLKATIISIVSVLIIGLTAILLYCFWPAIKGTVDNSKYYTQEELQESYDKGYNDGCKTETELTGQVKYYKSLVDEYYIQVNTLNDEITMLTKTKKDYETQIANIESQKANLQTQVNNLTTIKTNNETTIASLNNQIKNLIKSGEDNSERIASLNNQIKSLQNQVKNLTKSGEDKNEQITNLQKTISQLQTTNELNANSITSLNTQIANLNSQISEMRLISQNSQSQINALNNKIIELQKSVTYYESYIASLENGEQVVATFEYDGSVYNIQIVNKGSKLSVTTPTSTEYKIFNGWKVNGETIDLSTYTINANTKIVADVSYKYDVIFMVEGEEYTRQIVVKNGFVSYCGKPTKDDYEFVFWSLDGVNPVDVYNTPITNNTTYYAVFKFFGRNLDADYVSQLTKFNSKITRDTVSSMSFLSSTDKTNLLGTLNSGIKVYYSIDESGLFELDFVNSRINLTNNNSLRSPFANFYNLKTLNLSNLYTSYYSDFSGMFYDCRSLTSLDLSNFDTSNAKNMHSMFGGCRSLTSLDLSNFDTSLVKDMRDMFARCLSLTSLNVSNFNTSRVTNMSEMFLNCSSLTSLYVGNFDTSRVTGMRGMFDGCSSLTSLNVSNFDTSNVTDMSIMFYYCRSLTSLDISNFNTSNVTDMTDMFDMCENLHSSNIIVGENYTLNNLPE